MQIAVGFTMTSHTYFTTGYLNTEFKLRPLQYTTQVRFVNPGKAKNTILSPVKYSFKLTIHSSQSQTSISYISVTGFSCLLAILGPKTCGVVVGIYRRTLTLTFWDAISTDFFNYARTTIYILFSFPSSCTVQFFLNYPLSGYIVLVYTFTEIGVIWSSMYVFSRFIYAGVYNV